LDLPTGHHRQAQCLKIIVDHRDGADGDAGVGRGIDPNWQMGPCCSTAATGNTATIFPMSRAAKSPAVRSHHRCDLSFILDPNDAWAAADRLLPHQGKSRMNEAAGDRQYGLGKLMARSDHASVASEAFFSADPIAF
jgi:hypothetical protein